MEIVAQYAIGIDVGGTKIAGGLVDLQTAAIRARYTTPTAAARGGRAVLHDVVAMAAALGDAAVSQGISVNGIGLGVCELVSPQGAITSAHTIDWIGIPVASELAAIAPTVVESDVRAHARAEAYYGAGRDVQDFVFVTVGTGISSCLVLAGQPHAGAHGNALVLASSPLTTICPACGATAHPILEAIASGPAIAERYSRETGIPYSRAEAVFTAASAGEQVAVTILKDGGVALGVSLGWLVNILDPQALILGGGLGSIEGLYWDAMMAATRAHIWADTSRDVPIQHAMLGNDAGIIGAARSFDALQQ